MLGGRSISAAKIRASLGLEKYVTRTIERLRDAIMPDDEAGEPPLLPILNRYKPLGTTAEVNFKTMRACWPTQKSHIDQIVLDTETWESSAGFRLEQCASGETITPATIIWG